jgi:hypothetical protein
MAGMVVTTLGSYYMGDRLSATGSDIETRSRHFRLSLGLVPAGVDSLLGLGLGRYPAAYFWALATPRRRSRREMVDWLMSAKPRAESSRRISSWVL